MNKNIAQLATIRIQCNGETGTGVLYFPCGSADYVYVFTAKHCLAGQKFQKTFKKEEIVLDKIFNADSHTYSTYTLTETDIVITSDDSSDLALLILPKQSIISLTGQEFSYQVIDTQPAIQEYQIRGFAYFNQNKVDRPFPLRFVEDQKDNSNFFFLKSDQQLDTYYQEALENVQGLSGSGAFSVFKNTFYLTGIIQSYENGNIFSAAKVSSFNQIIPRAKFQSIEVTLPETDANVLDSFSEMGKNLKTASARARDKVGPVNVPRDIKPLLQQLQDSRLLVIHGKAGVGKSALAKALVSDFVATGRATIVTFIPEQLYCQTLAESLEKAGYSASLEKIISSPMSNGRVVVWIESFEKLIESGYEGAFNELLQLVEKRIQLSIVVTIRDYLLQKFKITYQYELPKNASYYQVSEFSEEELAIVRDAIPEIRPLLDNEKILHLLRTPYYLDKAARVVPELLREENLDEALFKRLMWEHIVEAGDAKRGLIFSNICLKRAREMSLYTTAEEPLDAVASLVRDNILQTEQSELADRYSPSHDILEDWALIRYIKQKKRDAVNPRSFLLTLEHSPAIKRAFRLWLDEFYRQEPELSVEFVYTLLLDFELSQAWKDELLIASLRTAHARPLLSALGPNLLADNCALLGRVIHLLETGCKTIDPKRQSFDQLLPIGTGWDFIIDFIKNNLDVVAASKHLEFRYIALIESWSKQLPDFNPIELPPAAHSAALLLVEFIKRYQDKVGGYNRRRLDSSYFKKYLEILFKLTASVPELIKGLLDRAIDLDSTDETWANTSTLELVRHNMTTGILSDQLCKYFPEHVFRAALMDWMEKEKPHLPGSLLGMIKEEPRRNDFGLDREFNSDYGFPSAYRTFLYWMFLHHPEKTLDFAIPFLNTAFERNKEVLMALNDSVEIVEVSFEDGDHRRYFGSIEYWAMYRGISSPNRLISSMLMALEAGLLDLTDTGPESYPIVRGYLRRLIKESNNVAVLGLVSSVLQAHPDLLDEISVSLLGIPIFFRWDSFRCNSEILERHVYNEDPLERDERIKSNHRPHRTKYYIGLVGFVADYMFYHRSQNELLFKQLDLMWQTADEEDKLWKKFLFDMDARKYEFKPLVHPLYKNMVQLVPGYDEDVKTNVISYDGLMGPVPKVNSMWARQVFEGKEVEDSNYSTWKVGYTYLRDNEHKNDFMTSPGTMAAIGLRDFFDQMDLDELTWCQQELVRLGEAYLKKQDVYNMGFDVLDQHPVLYGLSLIFKRTPDEICSRKAKDLIFRLLLSGIDERSRIYLDAGIARHLSKFEPDFARNCWYGLLAYIAYEINNNNTNRRNRFLFDAQSREHEKTAKDIWEQQLVDSVINGTIQAPEEIIVTLDMATHWTLDDALRIIPTTTDMEAHHDFIEKLLQCHIEFLNDKKQHHRYDYHESRHAFKYFYPRYILDQPLQKAKNIFISLLDLNLTIANDEITDDLRQFINEIVKEFVIAVNGGAPLLNFWELWECLRTWMIEHRNGLFLPIFLMDIEWSESFDDWGVLDGKKLYYKAFIEDWGFNNINSSVKLLTGVAFKKFMPDSISWIALMLKTKNAGDTNISLAGRFIEKSFYRYGSSIKNDKALLSDFLFILDFLIEKGLSKAYMLKEELIQYK